MVRTKGSGGKLAEGRLAQRVGMLVPFEARSALSWYASQMKRCFSGDAMTILAEDLPAERLHSSDCVPCWNRNAEDFARLNQVLANHSIDILHIAAFRQFFPADKFRPYLAELKQRRILTVLDVQSASVIDQNLLATLRAVDRVIVPDAQTALELIAQGVSASRVQTMPQGALQGVPVIQSGDARSSLGLAGNDPVVMTFTDGLGGEELEKLVRAVQSARAKENNLRLFVAPIDSVENSAGFDYRRERVEELRRRYADRPWVQIPDRAFGCDDLPRLIAATSVVAFTANEPAFELAQALCLCFEQHRPVIAPSVKPFIEHAERVILPGEGLSLASSVAAALANSELIGALESAAKIWAEDHSFEQFVSRLADVYNALRDGSAAKPASAASATPLATKIETVRTAVHRLPRILMQCRENAYTQPGGDTIVMDGISSGLRARGLHIDVDTRGEKNPRDYDLVHLYNFALKEHTEKLARRCQQLRVPYVVTTMYEDWPIFQNQMMAHCEALQAYLQSGQSKAVWPELLRTAKSARPAPIWDNSFTANGASALLASGVSEAQALRRDYPAAKLIEVCPVAADYLDFRDGGDLFRRETGLKDFVLCIGRFEVRKNQLMLLKALEDSDLTLVFAGGGFSYQPAYAELCRRFKRRGNTVFLDRLEPKMLASAVQAARVHALPGWLELPGIVSLEAASFGTNIVVTDFGTARDYFANDAFYCHPGEPDSILNAVEAAYHAPARPSLRERAKTFTWDRSALRGGEIYQLVLGSRGDFDWSFLREERAPLPPREISVEESVRSASAEARAAGRSVGLIPVMVGEVSDGPQKVNAAKQLCDEGDDLVRSGDVNGAKRKYAGAIEAAPNFPRGYRSCGAVALNQRLFPEAKEFFTKALELDSEDIRSKIGLASTRWEMDEKEKAFELFLNAAEQDPSNALAIFHLVRTAYAIDRLKDLEQALRAFLKSDPDNINILYCLAGCSFRRGRFYLAGSVVERILKLDPVHKDALELKQKIRDEQRARISKKIASASESAAMNLEEKMRELDIEKRNRDNDAVLRIAEDILVNPAARPDQIAMAKVCKAESLGLAGQLDEADAILAMLETEQSVAARAIAARGAISAGRNNFKQARLYFERALKIEPDYDVALAGLGLAESQDGRIEEAWNYFKGALKSNPENLRAIYGLIQLGYTLKRVPEVAQALETYLEHRPVDLAINYSYAGCCYALGQNEKALQELQKILLFDPQHRLANELLDKIRAEERQKVAHAG